ncbi:MAG: energy transducer TonB [Bradymonadaceae bacterium]
MTSSRRGGWALPVAIVIVLHLGVALVPLHFSELESSEPPPIRLNLSMPEPVVEPLPEPVVEVPPERVVEPVPEPEQRPRRVEPKIARKPPIEPAPSPVKTDIAVPEVAEIAPAEEAVVEAEIPVEEEVEPVEVAEAAPEPVKVPPVVEKADMNRYGMGVFQAVNAEQRYPRMAERRRLEGTATVRVRIKKDGTLAGRPAIVESSQYDLLDEEVLRMVEIAAPFSPLPDGFHESEAELIIPVRFRLRG